MQTAHLDVIEETMWIMGARGSEVLMPETSLTGCVALMEHWDRLAYETWCDGVVAATD